MTETRPAISLNEQSLKTWNEQDLERIRYEYDLNQEDTVVDLGAYKGEWADKIYRQYLCNMVLVEPTEYVMGLEFPHVVYNKAASTHEGKMQFGGRAYYTSVMEPGDHEYPCMDVNIVIERCCFVALLKVNIEGSEYDVLNHIIDAGLHWRIKNIQVQFHEIAGRPYEIWYEEIAKKLSKTHHLTWRYPYCWENWKLNEAD